MRAAGHPAAHARARSRSAAAAGRLGEHLRLRAYGQSGSEFHSLREYVRGDDLRRISWKASARASELIVKETALEGVRRCTVVLDVDADEYDDDGVRAGRVRRGEPRHRRGRGRAARPGWSRPDIDLRGPDVAASALRWLATVQPGEHARCRSLPTLRAGEGLGVLVRRHRLARSAACAAQVRGSLSPDDTLVVVAATRSPAAARDRFVVDATVADAFADSLGASSPGRSCTAPSRAGRRHERTSAADDGRPRAASDADASAATRVGSRSDNAIASTRVLTLLTIVTAIGMCRVFADWAFLRPLWSRGRRRPRRVGSLLRIAACARVRRAAGARCS